MELDWSERSPHIRSLYRPWQPGDGYEEATLVAEEARLGFALPAPLRTFYQAWGLRRDMTRKDHFLRSLDKLQVWNEALVFCTENQGVYFWGIRSQDLEKPNPAVVIAVAEEELIWEPCHAGLSDFLDDLAYNHAFCGGAIHGGYTQFFKYQDFQERWLQQHWQQIFVGEDAPRLIPESPFPDLPPYIREGQALHSYYGCSVATNSAQALDEISEALQITWEERW